jgi:hypothetical protein
MTNRNSTVAPAGASIVFQTFNRILESWSSPALVEAAEIFAALLRLKVDPAFILAIFWQESNGGTNGLAVANRNPGNQRTTRTGAGRPVPTAKGEFIQFDTWLDGFTDLAFRLVDPAYVYVKENRRTINDIIYRLSPPEDGNKTEDYILGVVKNMTNWQNGTAMPDPSEIGFQVLSRPAAPSEIGAARRIQDITGFCVHNTQGNLAGDLIELTRADDKVASCHALIAKDGRTYFMVGLLRTAWTPGNNAVAETSVNVELSGYMTDGYTDQQYTALANFYTGCVAQGCNIPAEFVGTSGRPGIFGHEHVPNPNWPKRGYQFGGVSNHTDPGPLFDWNRFVSLCKGVEKPMSLPFGAVKNADGSLTIPLAPDHANDVVLNFGFLRYFLTAGDNLAVGSDLGAAILRGAKLFGLPLESESTDPATKVATQKFENVTFIYNPALPEEWKVRTKRVN